MSTIYSIGGMGLRPITDSGIFKGEGQVYFYGASSSPDMIVVTKITPNRIYFRRYPYYKESFETMPVVFWDLVTRGTQTWLKSGYARYFPDRAESFRKVLAGQAGTPVDYRDFQRVKLHVSVPADVKDPWSDFERRFRAHSVSGSFGEPETLELFTDRADARALRAELVDSGYSIISETDEVG